MTGKFKTCSISNCGKAPHAKGYCSSHYDRLRKHGDPLGGGTSRGEPMRFVHEVALRHIGDECLIWPFGSDGYGKLWVEGKVVGAYRYICELVNGPPPTPEHEAAHNCGKGHLGCISPGHLEWKTHAENEADKLEHGTHNRGERHGCAKLSEAAVLEILALKGVESQRNLAKRFMISQTTISYIHAGRSWAWL
jgi:hypothetical protein